MRTEVFFSILIIALAFVSGALVLTIKNGPVFTATVPILEQEIQKFKKSQSSVYHLRTDGIAEIIDPQYALPFYFKYNYQEVKALQNFLISCKSKNLKKSAPLRKAWQWEEFKCGQRKLNDEFFSIPPFFNPSGHSFAYLAKKDPSWIKKNLNLFHASELKVLEIPKLPTPYKYLATLDMNSMTALSTGDPIVITGQFVFLNSHDDTGYEIYPQNVWNSYWKTTPFIPHSYQIGENCFIKENSVCWNFDVQKIYFPKWNPLVFLLGLSIILAISIFVLLAIRIYKRQQDQIRLKFTLEMLAHEIRTPATNLTLTVENFRSNFDKFPEDTKSGLLRMFDQVERIKRVAESSHNYLNKNLKANLIETNFSEIGSLQQFIKHTLDAYLSQIELEINNQEMRIILDPYWTSICIKNLVENALMHGVKPVKVVVNQNGKNWSIEISDQGIKPFNPLIKAENSRGFGLGFKIVKSIVPEIHGVLDISYNPTKMKITFGEKL